ncbi:MAG: hypothetical protein ACLU6P_10050 [Roseburia intestinalis]
MTETTGKHRETTSDGNNQKLKAFLSNVTESTGKRQKQRKTQKLPVTESTEKDGRNRKPEGTETTEETRDKSNEFLSKGYSDC